MHFPTALETRRVLDVKTGIVHLLRNDAKITKSETRVEVTTDPLTCPDCIELAEVYDWVNY